VSAENSVEIGTPSRRALLKTAVAGGAFAVPLIASFSMDSASAKTKSQTVIVSNMVCSNMTAVPNVVFIAELQQLGMAGSGTGPVIGNAAFEFLRGRNYVSYQILVSGRISDFILTGGNLGFLAVEGSATRGRISGSQLDCGDSGINTLYQAFASGQANLEIDLADGTEMVGMIRHYSPGDPYLSF
jgi:hypothetical protein